MGRERLQVLISFIRNSRVGQKGEVGTSLAYNVHGKVGYLLLQKQFTTKISGLMEWFIIVFLDSVGWLCSTRWFSHRVSHVVAVRWQLGPRPSEGLTGLDIWDSSLPWPALDVGSEFSCDCEPDPYKQLLYVFVASCRWWMKGSVPQARTQREPRRSFYGFLWPSFRRPKRSILLVRPSLVCVK